MDDYLATPLKAQALGAMLSRWLTGPGELVARRSSYEPATRDRPGEGEPRGAAEIVSRSALDQAVIEELRDVLGQGLDEVVEVFLQEAPGQVDALRAALERGDVEHLLKTTHVLGSSSSNLGASGLSALCRSLESAAREQRRQDAVDDVSRIRAELERVSTEFHRLREGERQSRPAAGEAGDGACAATDSTSASSTSLGRSAMTM